jgi:hypothetical protein
MFKLHPGRPEGHPLAALCESDEAGEEVTPAGLALIVALELRRQAHVLESERARSVAG